MSFDKIPLCLFLAGSADAWCKSGFKDCDYNPHNGCETCIQKDVKNCGDCGVQCPTYPYTKPTCSNGKCGYTCSSGWTDCDHKKENGCEANTKSDLKNCGKCGVQCKSYPYSITKCNDGKCESTCTQGWKDCNHNMQHDGCETDVGKDVFNCGGCGKKCPCNDFNALPTCRYLLTYIHAYAHLLSISMAMAVAEEEVWQHRFLNHIILGRTVPATASIILRHE
jgi:hypothetical protein